MSTVPLARALRPVPTAVALLTAHDPDEGDAVTTVGSFTSVSADPPVVAVGLLAGSWPQEVVSASGRFALSFLADGHRLLAARFATPARPSAAILLREVPHERGGASGALVLTDAVAALECEVDRELEVGDHVLVLGRVLTARTGRGTALVRVGGGYA